MRNRDDRRKSKDTSTHEFEDISLTAPERRKHRDRRLANMNAEERQLELSEMPGICTGKPTRKD